MKSFAKFLLASAAVFITASCGYDSANRAPATTEGSNLQSLSVKYEPEVGMLLVSAMLARKKGSEQEFVYFTGPLKKDVPLKNPIEGTEQSFTCLDASCRRLEMVLAGKRLALGDKLRITLQTPIGYRTEGGGDTAGDPSKYNFARVWKKLLRDGVEPLRCSLAEAVYGKTTYYGLYLSGNRAGAPTEVHLAGAYGNDRIETNYTHFPDRASGPVFSLGFETGAVSRERDRFEVRLLGTRLEAELVP